MKKIYITVALAAMTLFGSTGCSDFLDEEMKSTLGPDNTYTSSYGFEVATTGLYAWARDEFGTWGGDAFSHYQACPYEALQIATDIVFQGPTQDGSLKPFARLDILPSTRFVESYWEWAYGLIASSNELLAYSEKNTNWDKPGDKEFYQANARFFRAYAYRYLVYLYGDVPFVDKIEDKFRLDFTRTPKAEVINHIIEDLEFAAKYLPSNPDELLPGKLTSWAAKHYLAEAYICSGRYDDAVKACDDVINSGNYSLTTDRFGTNVGKDGDFYSDMFLEGNQNRTSGNKESIWVMQFEYNTQGGAGGFIDWTKRAWVPKYWEEPGFKISGECGGRGLAQIQPLKWWIMNPDFYDETDVRNSEFNIKRTWVANDPNKPELFGKVIPITDETYRTGHLYPVPTKSFYYVADDPTYGGNNKDRMRIRLSETYLLKAEACIQKGDAQGAAEAINAVRVRAKAKPITAEMATMDFLLDERIRELIGEEQRRFVLLRTGKFVERANKYDNPDFKKGDLTEEKTYWPIPQSVIDANTDAEFPQNPGY